MSKLTPAAVLDAIQRLAQAGRHAGSTVSRYSSTGAGHWRGRVRALQISLRSNAVIARLFPSKNRRFFKFNYTKDGVRINVKGRHVVAYNDIESALAGALAGLGIV